jgi:hypothetical protein
MTFNTMPYVPVFGEQTTEAGYRMGLGLWGLLPRPLRLLDRKGVAAQARLLCLACGELLAELLGKLQQLRDNRHPLLAAEWALPFLAWERWLPQLGGETIEQWRSRLRDAFLLHQEGGTNPGVLRVLRLLGFASAEVYEHFNHAWYYNGQVAYDGSRPYGGPTDTWAHFSVVFPGVWLMASDVVTRLRAAVAKVKAGHALLASFRGRVDTFYDGTWAYDGSVMYDGETVVLWEE